ncbi:nucleoside hydrolase [Corynebacterium macginleyi]|uniref:nucleoside hydrolase n=1 Tax=Corynebacterium macginleyi TaxID=38290 RepID=UPI00190A436C|nr:nucleoside hydrolase [Corynebacterium macginleyi]MBK4182313.1 nucleoside hydrolase [Corynebacterium macginleyi]
MSFSRPAVLLDCDPGIDDCLALLYLAGLHHADEIELVGVSTTAGNAEVQQTAANARWILDLCGLPKIPVAPGRPRPLQVELTTTPETHGETGLGYLSAPNHDFSDIHWRDLWSTAIDHNPGLHLIITGPVTNLADFEREHGEAVARCGSITIMGGAVNYRGNTTPTAEWNFWVDPHAAARHFSASAELHSTLCSLEVTEQFLITPQRLAEIKGLLGTHPMAEKLPEILRFYFEFHEKQGEGYQAQIHDLLTCIIALQKIPFETVETTIDVEADSVQMRGTSVADLCNHWGRPANASLVTSADIPAAHREFDRALRVLGGRVARGE